MEVLGIDPIQRLVVPRVLASMLVAVLLNGLVSVVGVAGGYFFNVILQGGTPGAYLASFQALGQLPDLMVGEVKALVFGAVAALVASYKGMTAKGGPKGVGDAVNQSVVITFMLLFALNFVLTAIYFQVVPQKGSLTMAGAARSSTTSADSWPSTCARSPGRRAPLRRYRREVVRLLAEVSFGSGALAVIGGTVGVIAS